MLLQVADPLIEKGGLMKFSEGGSLEERLAVEAEGESADLVHHYEEHSAHCL